MGDDVLEEIFNIFFLCDFVNWVLCRVEMYFGLLNCYSIYNNGVLKLC